MISDCLCCTRNVPSYQPICLINVYFLSVAGVLHPKASSRVNQTACTVQEVNTVPSVYVCQSMSFCTCITAFAKSYSFSVCMCFRVCVCLWVCVWPKRGVGRKEDRRVEQKSNHLIAAFFISIFCFMAAEGRRATRDCDSWTLGRLVSSAIPHRHPAARVPKAPTQLLWWIWLVFLFFFICLFVFILWLHYLHLVLVGGA